LASKRKLIAETIFINRFWAWAAATIGFCNIRPAVLNFWFTAPPGSVCNLGLPFSWIQLKRPSQLQLQSTNGIYEFLLFHVGLFRFQYPAHISTLNKKSSDSAVSYRNDLILTRINLNSSYEHTNSVICTGKLVLKSHTPPVRCCDWLRFCYTFVDITLPELVSAIFPRLGYVDPVTLPKEESDPMNIGHRTEV